MSALNKKSFLTYLKEGGIYVVLLVLLASHRCVLLSRSVWQG